MQLRKTAKGMKSNANCLCSTFCLLGLVVLLNSCKIYSFQQGTIPPEVKTISIANVINESGKGPVNIGQIFTEKLKSYYQQNSRLPIVPSNGDWELEGKIVYYETLPIAPQGDVGGANRLTIRMDVDFVSNIDEKANFKQGFTFFQDYEKNQTLTLVEADLVQAISDVIVFDIFNKTTSNW